ncbi:MAG: hypothetical protein ABIP36_04665 [Acidimicrobiales bacterium]
MPPPAPIRRAAVVGAAVALVVFAALVSEGSPSGLIERGPFTSDFFDEQAHSLLDGRLDIDPEVAGIEGFDHDARTYLYFGLVPAVLRLPVAALTDELDGRLTQLSMLLALAVALWATTQLAWRARCWKRGDDDLRTWEPAVVGAFVATVGLASPLLFLAARPVVYHEVELWGTATTLVAFNALLRWWDDPSRANLALASFTALIAFNTRASVGSGALAALGLVAVAALLAGRRSWRRSPALVLAVLAPLALYATVNLLRFDTPFAIPFEDQALSDIDEARQATLEATEGTLFGPEFAPSALATYLRPDGVELQRLFPWVTFRESRTVLGDPVFDTVDRAASLPVVAPTLLAFGGAGLAALLRRRAADPWLPMTVGAAAGLVSTLTIAFIAHRYLADFTPLLVLLAGPGLWVVADRVAAAELTTRRIVLGGLALATVVSSAASLALALQSQRLFILPEDSTRTGFVAFQYDLDDRLATDPPAEVRRGVPVAGEGRRGDVMLLADCAGTYWFEGPRWWPLELGGELGWTLSGPLPEGRTTLISAERWSIVAEVAASTVRVSYELEDGFVREGLPVDLAASADHRAAVTLDRVNNELVVHLDDELALTAWLVDLTGDVRVDPVWRAASMPTPLCERLDERLGG